MVTQLALAPLQTPVLDPRNDSDLLRRSIARVFASSSGRLNSFSKGDPVRALLEGQVFATAELLYYLNQLPEAYGIEFLKIMGIQRILGTASTANITFTLTKPLSNTFTVPAQFRCLTTARLEFRTNSTLLIPPGVISGTITATCTTVGSQGNVGAYAIRSFQTPLTYLKSVTNVAPATGGVDAETLDQTKTRAFAAIRRRGLVTKDDYEQEAIAILGQGAVAHAVGNLGADGLQVIKGAVHLFCLNKDGGLLSDAQLTTLQASLSAKSHLGTDTYVSNIGLVDIDVRVIADLVPGTNPSTIAGNIWARLQSYLKPGTLELGKSVLLKELEFQVRLAGVQTVQSVLVGDHLSYLSATNYILPYSYSAANLKGAVVEIVLTNGATNTYSYGEGDPD